MGRPMPYPALLHKAAGIPSRAANQYALVQSEIPREFAEFIDFVGAQALDKEIRKIERKLSTSAAARQLYGDRYFFQEQCVRFTEDIPSFQLNISDPRAVRAASLIAGINRVKRSLSPTGMSRFRSMVIDNLKPHRDMRQLEHEIRCSTHFAKKGIKVVFSDLESLGKFDLLLHLSGCKVEVECKTIADRTGSQLKPELITTVADSFEPAAKTVSVESGLFTLTLNKAADLCKNLGSQLKTALKSSTVRCHETKDFSLRFSPRPAWQRLLNAERWLELDRHIRLDSDEGEYARTFTISHGKVLALDIRPHASSVFRSRVVGILKEAADKFTGKNPGLVWLHFVGCAEAEFLSLCEFSMAGSGAGLNAIVADTLHPDLSSTDRCHVQLVRFSGDSNTLSRHPILDSNLILTQGVSHGGKCYDVPNPRSRFPELSDL
jgi:hypothetical protein